MAEILITALLSAGLTLAGAYIVGRWAVERQLAPLVQAEVDRRLDALGELIESRVKDGVVGAVEEVTSPQSLHKQMSKGQDSLLNAIFGKGTG